MPLGEAPGSVTPVQVQVALPWRFCDPLGAQSRSVTALGLVTSTRILNEPVPLALVVVFSQEADMECRPSLIVTGKVTLSPVTFLVMATEPSPRSRVTESTFLLSVVMVTVVCTPLAGLPSESSLTPRPHRGATAMSLGAGKKPQQSHLGMEVSTYTGLIVGLQVAVSLPPGKVTVTVALMSLLTFCLSSVPLKMATPTESGLMVLEG